MKTTVNLFLLTAAGIVIPFLCNLIAQTGFLHPFVMMGIMVICLMLLVYNGTLGTLMGKNQGWNQLMVILFALLNLGPAVYFAFTLFPQWLGNMML